MGRCSQSPACRALRAPARRTRDQVGARELAVEDFTVLVGGHMPPALEGQLAKWTAPASGLFLERVRYAGDPPLDPLAPAFAVP